MRYVALAVRQGLAGVERLADSVALLTQRATDPMLSGVAHLLPKASSVAFIDTAIRPSTQRPRKRGQLPRSVFLQDIVFLQPYSGSKLR
jgi:hypothetical protein